jgi:TolB-like protein/class 3 adenylate cyclase/Tfp pilus assembly protein PilF
MAGEVKKEIQLEIAHVLFIDIVGYSRLLINEQRALLDALNEIVRKTDEFQTAEEAGRLLKLPTGDGMALVFYNSPEAPVECALEISRALKDRPKLRVRMGVHSGPISGVLGVDGKANVAGAGINIAQRVMDCGDAGHILLSKHVAEDLEQYGHWQPHLHDLGECEVKHGKRVHVVNLYTDELGNPEVPEKLRRAKEKEQIAEAARSPARSKWLLITLGLLIFSLIGLAIVAIIFATAATKFFSPHRAAPPNPAPFASPAAIAPAIAEKSIAVLPFQNLSEDKANAYFADGIQDEILTRLSKIADLKVISRTSTQHYKSAPENLPEIARQHGVANIVEGSVQKNRDAVRVNVQLIKAANDSHLWAESFDRKLTDIFSVESEVARAIADQLRAKLTGQEEQVIAAKPTNNPQAYDAYLRGLAYTLRTAFSPTNTLNAQKYLKEAVNLDPKFALGWALLSYVDSIGYITTFLQPTISLREEARQAAESALTLQPDIGEAVLAKGFYHYACLKDYDTAERYFERARQFLPNSSQIPAYLAYVTRRRGQWDRSEQYFQEAEQLDPRNTSLLAQHAFSYIHLRHFPEAQRKLDEILDITPDDLDTIVTKAAIAQAEGDLPRASAILAPLHPAANNTIALERQTYQAILERRPGAIIPTLKEILAQPDPALGYFNGELRFWLGWAQAVAGDQAAAQESWREARGELESFLKEQPENHFLIGDLALINMGLGDKAAAFAMVERCMAVNPVEKDAIAGPRSLEIAARIAAEMGEPDRAIAALEKLLSIPHSGHLDRSLPLTPALLGLDPMFDRLRNDPRFQKLVASPALKATPEEAR